MSLGNMSMLEYAKTLDLNNPENAVIMMIATSNPIFALMPVETIQSGIKKWILVNSYSNTTQSVAVRNFDSDYSPTKTISYSMTSNAKIYGGKVRVDRALSARDPYQAQLQLQGALASQGRAIVKDIFEGTKGSYLTGIASMVEDADMIPYNAQIQACGTSTTGAVISEDIMMQAIAKQNVKPGKTFFFGSKKVCMALKKLSRGNASAGQNIPWNPAQFGMSADSFDGIPIVPVVDALGNDILNVTRGTDQTSSYGYLVTFGETDFTGFQVEPMKVYNLGDKTSLQDVDVEWQIGTAAYSSRCITVISYIKDALA